MGALVLVLILGGFQNRAEVPVAPVPALRQGPTLVVLLKEGCPCIQECRTQLNAMARACRGKIKFVGVLNANGAKTKRLIESASLDFPVLPDPTTSAIRALHGRETLNIRLLSAKGAVLAGWEGLSRSIIRDVAYQTREMIKVEIIFDVQNLTSLTKSGCRF